MARYDAVVVGAGPAGSATAAHLASAGARVLLVDRSAFPRDKACGGGLTPRGVAALSGLGIDTSTPQFARVGGLEMTADGRTLATRFPATMRWPDYGAVVRRFDLDAKILARAGAAGADTRFGVRAVGPLMENGSCRGVRLRSDAGVEDVTAAWTIAADGATSVVARGAGAAPSASSGGFWYTALRAYFSGVVPHGHEGEHVLEFYPLRGSDGRWLPAYGWVFPLPGGSANIGVDIPHAPKLAACPPLREAYASFIAQLRRDRPGFGDATEEAPPVGALLPEAMSGFRPGVAGMLCVGDAAGLITPYSGEGIVYALEGAERAATAILKGASPTDTARAYGRALWDDYGFQFRWALSFMKAMRRRPMARAAAVLGLRSRRVLRAAVRIMAFLIEEDASGPPSTISRGYLRFRGTFPGSAPRV
jgi:geranylgeranyl reductase family protein